MTRLILFGIALAFITACAGRNAVKAETANVDIGLIPIGAAPQKITSFVGSDCNTALEGVSDCSAQDANGVQYAFFDGVLSKVSINGLEASHNLHLPAGMKFGEKIKLSASKLRALIGVEMDRTTSSSGLITYSSDFVIQSAAGIMYSIELVANKEGQLAEVIERTDF